MSIERLQRFSDTATAPWVQALGVRVTAAEPGDVTFDLEVRAEQVHTGGVLCGQAIMAASSRPDLVEAVIATAPAAHGESQRPNNLGAGLDDFRRLLAGLPAEAPRLLVALFEGDGYDPDPERRALMLEATARERPAPLLVLWPRGEGRGHAGVGDWRFTRAMGGCVLTLVQAPAAAAPRGLRREPCGGG